MNVLEALAVRVAGECGQRRWTIPRHYFYADDAPARLAETLRRETGGRSVLIFSDARTRAVAGEACLRALRDAGWETRECLIPDGPGSSGPVCDDRTSDGLRAKIARADIFIAVGSGVVNDLTK